MKWATRKRPHVDRCATAWLVKRHIDPKATFLFVDGPDSVPKDATPFDLPGVEYGHHGTSCTFETAVAKHKLGKTPGVAPLAKIVHDLDFHASKLPESPGLDAILRGLTMTEADDAKVVEKALVVFDALAAYLAAREAAR